MSVFTLAHCTSYMAFTASLIFCLLAVISTMKTRVLISSIFFIADSVVSGYLMIEYLSSFVRPATDLRGYFGSRFLIKVLGKKKWTFRRFLELLREMVCFTAFAVLFAFEFFGAFFSSTSAAAAFGS